MTTRQGRRPTGRSLDDLQQAWCAIGDAARDRAPVAGWTHNFYRYPARFSPRFAAAAIQALSRPGDLVLDPYMGGGTTVLESLAAGRHVIGSDLNSLATFITKVKITGLTLAERRALRTWAEHEVPSFTYDLPAEDVSAFIDESKTRNLSLARARFIKKSMAAALASIVELQTSNAQDFARCALLRVAQWALDGRKRHTPLADFRDRLARTTHEMLDALSGFAAHVSDTGGRATLLNTDAADLPRAAAFADSRSRAALVVTSPPYPGVHVLYHRWQVDGRRETPAPYWVAGCNDGQGASFYNFGDRREAAAERYFETSLRTLLAIRGVMRDGGYVVQMVAFNKPEEQLPRYLENMRLAGFSEARVDATRELDEGRIWREVPGRKWHATLRGKTESSREVVLIHRAE
ncbi:MAG: hypothetical protein KIS87_02510 [Phycisphaeraceae bacterium]|nr:hypothetical protein [Phycisphaeraceae bacterium]